MTCSSPHLTALLPPLNSTARRKRRMISLLLGAAGTGMLLFLSACKHEVVEPVELPPPTVQQRLSVIFNYGNHDYELASTYLDTMGHLFKLDTLCFIVSAIQAEDDDEGVITEFEGVQLVANAANASNDFLLGPLTTGHLHQLRFDLGLRPEEDQILPPNGSEMATMYCGTNTDGYHFLLISGQVDGNGDGELDTNDPRFSFRCTGEALRRSNTSPVHADLIQGGSLTAALPIDLELLLAGIDLLATASSDGDAPINARLMDQLVIATTQEH